MIRAMRGADCWTDHRLILAKMRLQIRPRPRRSGTAKKLNCDSLRNPQVRESYENMVQELTQEIDGQESDSLSTKWDNLATRLMAAAQGILGVSTRKHRDWFRESSHEISALLSEKNEAHQAALRNPSSTFLRQRFSELRSSAQARLRALEGQWWDQLAHEIQGYADTNDMHNFYQSTKRRTRITAPVRSADDVTLLCNKTDVTSE